MKISVLATQVQCGEKGKEEGAVVSLTFPDSLVKTAVDLNQHNYCWEKLHCCSLTFLVEITIQGLKYDSPSTPRETILARIASFAGRVWVRIRFYLASFFGTFETVWIWFSVARKQRN